MNYKRILIVVFACTIPLVLFLSSVQAYNYMKLKHEIEKLEADQKDWLEKNKKLIASIEVLRTPQRIEKLALEQLGLEKIARDHVTLIEFE